MSNASIGALSLAAILGLYLAVFSGAQQMLVGPDGETVTAKFSNTGQLSKGDPVRVAGIKVGAVKSLDLDPGGRTTTVRMKVEKDALPLYGDASATLRWRTLLGGAFTVDLDRGTRARGELGDRPIGLGRTAGQVELEDVTGALRGDARKGLKETLDELGRGLSDTDAPARLLDRVAAIAPQATEGLASLRGRRAGDLRRLVLHTGRMVRAADAPGAPLRDLVEGAARAAGSVARRNADLRTTLRLAGEVMPAARATLADLNQTLTLADPLIARLDRPARDLAPTAAALRPTLTGADRLLRDAHPLVASLRPALRALALAAQDGTPLLRGVEPSLDRAAHRILPDLARKSPESQHRTYEMIGPTVASLHGAGSSFDGEANFARLFGSGSGRALDTLPCRSFIEDPSDPRWFDCQTLMRALRTIFGGTGTR